MLFCSRRGLAAAHGSVGGAQTTPAAPGASTKTAMYQKLGHNFLAELRTLGPRAMLGHIKVNLTLITAAGLFFSGYLLYYSSTYKYTLTSNASPYRNTLFQEYPCDYAVLENKWTGKQTVVSVHDDPLSGKHVERVLRVNALMHRVWRYLNVTPLRVVLDMADELQPDRFMAKTARTEDVGWRRRANFEAQFPHLVPSSSSAPVNGAGVQVSGPTRIVIDLSIRPLWHRNGYQKGTQLAVEKCLRTTMCDLVAERYRRAILAAKAPVASSQVYGEELLKSGVINGVGISLAQVVPDPVVLESDIVDELRRRMGNEVIILSHRLAMV